MSRVYVPSEKIGAVLICGKLQLKPQIMIMASNKYKLLTYLAVISYLDKLVQPSYMLSAQICPLALPRAS